MTFVVDLRVAQNLLVDEPLDFGDLGGIDRGVVREVEAQPRRLDDAARLLDVRAENLAQRGMQKMGRGVIAHGGPAFGNADLGAQFVADPNTRRRADLVDCQSGHGRARVFDDGDNFARMRLAERAAIADLAAGFGVERRLIENQFGFDAGGNLVGKFLILQQAAHGGDRVELVVAEEFRAAAFEQLSISRRDGALFAALPAGAGAHPLKIHLGIEALAVDCDTALASHVFLLVEREAVGVVEFERDGAGHRPVGKARDLVR